MGGDARNLILPVPIGPRGVASWKQHQGRNPRSSEPGTDIYCDRGTEVVAPADGVIYGYGESVEPATGFWVGIDFDSGMSFRCMHHSRITRKTGRVRQGDVIALSGSTGYGSVYFGESSENQAFWSNTGGPHTHATLWPTRDKRFGYGRDGDPNKPYTIDLMDYIQEGFTVNAQEEDRLKDLVKLALTELQGNDGRNLLDSVLQTRAELRDRAAEGAKTALYEARGNDGRNLFDGVIQSRNEIAAIAARVGAGGIDPANLAAAIDKAGLAQAVANELAKRLTN